MARHLLKISRLEGLTDGIFAIAMTIMVLNLHVPTHIQTDAIQSLARTDMFRNLLIYVGSFAILATHWIAMNFQWGLLDHLNRVYLWANMFYLMVICVVPFSANLIGEYPYNAGSIHFYAINLMCCSLGQYVTLHCAHYYKLYSEGYTEVIYRAAVLRILIAPVFYLSSLIVAHWDTSAAFVLLVAPTIIYTIPGRIDRYESN